MKKENERAKKAILKEQTRSEGFLKKAAMKSVMQEPIPWFSKKTGIKKGFLLPKAGKDTNIGDMELTPNPGKKLTIEVNGKKYNRYPIKTHFVALSEKIEDLIEKYCLEFVRPADIIILGQKIVSLAQTRVIEKNKVKIGFWAKFLSRFVTKTPYGFSVGNPLKMQVAIEAAGLPRIILASICGFVAKLLGIRGVFYRVAGHQISELDGFYGEAFPEYLEMGILGPKDCDKLCGELKNKYGFSFAVADVNDLGGNILGASADLKERKSLLKEILKDNPAGQGNEQTPIIIIREINA